MSPEEVQSTLEYFESLSNWGRWGPDDRLGTLNLITPEVRQRAAALVREGEVVSLSFDMDPEKPDPLRRGTRLERTMDVRMVERRLGPGVPWDAAGEHIGIDAHGSYTHLDGLAHYSWKGKHYNGFDASRTDETHGAADLSVHQASQGIITRGILLDVPAALGMTWLPADHAITPEELEAAERRQGIRVESGDALLIYTGHFARFAVEGGEHAEFVPGRPQEPQPGLDASCLPFLRERDVAVLGCDGIQDVHQATMRPFELYQPIHQIGLVALGLWLIDNMALDDLAARCRADDRHTFLFTMLPWRLVGVTASATNPVAVF
jgi:kynurenine formamidase